MESLSNKKDIKKLESPEWKKNYVTRLLEDGIKTLIHKDKSVRSSNTKLKHDIVKRSLDSF